MLTRENFTGPWAGLPVAWTDQDHFDEDTYRADVGRCCDAGIPGVYTAGTSGEFYAMEFDEWKAITRATIEEAHRHHRPAMIGCTSTYSLGAVRRASFAVECGADAIQLALPFWMEINDAQVVPFFREVAHAADGLPLSIYETRRARKSLTLDQHRAIKDAVPQYVHLKANVDTVGCTPEGCSALSEYVNVFVGEDKFVDLGQCGARGGCSSLVYWNPPLLLALWKQVEQQDWEGASPICRKFASLFQFLGKTFGPRGITDSAFDRLGTTAGRFLHCGLRCRGPYPSATEDDVETLRNWYRDHFPQMIGEPLSSGER